MLSPKKRLGRRIEEKIQDVAQGIRASKGTRKIKKTLKDSSKESVEKVASTRREDRRTKLEAQSKEKKYSTTRTPKRERKNLSGSDYGFSAKKTASIVPTSRANRAVRTLGRMDEQDKRRRNRKIK